MSLLMLRFLYYISTSQGSNVNMQVVLEVQFNWFVDS